ncbi:MAG: TonB-dependent receptor plug domain-containing protein, partial [Beijerinckiaceae bacterium]|nr:TonB-dependent receptor plug domain-containing protein [Beijerinckiaceae bacterium]
MRDFLLGGAAAIIWMPAPLMAQEPADPVAAASSDEIVVTARKRSESIVNVPISIEAVSGKELEAFAIRDVESAAKLVPNLYVDKVAAGPRVSIRGLGNSQTGGQVDSSVGLGIDGVFFGRPRWLQIGLFDLESFEVLRGPQSTYFGKNSTAGLINIRTRGPADQIEGYVDASHEFAFDGWNGEAAIGGPVTDTLGVRLAYRHTETDGFLR